MISVVKHCCMQNDSIQMYLWKNKVTPGYNIGKKQTIKHCFITGNSLLCLLMSTEVDNFLKFSTVPANGKSALYWYTYGSVKIIKCDAQVQPKVSHC